MNDLLTWIPILLSGIVTFYNLYSVIKVIRKRKKSEDEIIEIRKMIKQAESSLTSANKLCMQNRGSAILYDNMKDIENLQSILKEIYVEVESCKKISESPEKVS